MSTRTLITADEFAKTGPDTDGFELVRGELLPMPPPADRHGIVNANIVYLTKTYTRSIGKGTVLANDSGLLTQKGPDTVRGVDVMVFLNPQKVGKGLGSIYPDEPPDLAVEVRSPSQSWKEMMDKVLDYLNMGVKMVWVVDPQVRRVTVYTQDKDPHIFAAENELDGGDALPGFRCKVEEIFEGI